MITPQFTVTQDDEYVYINIRAVHIKAVNIEFFVENDLFIFSLHPYYLRLRFPGNLVDDEERTKTDYSVETGYINTRIAKQNKGEHFKDLDMLTKLLARKGDDQTDKEVKKKPIIEEMDSESGTQEGQPVENEEIAAAEEFDWEIEQTLNTGEDDVLGKARYGFDSNYSGMVGMSLANGNDINELDDPEQSSAQERSEERETKVNEKFDPDYYVADLHDNETIADVLAFKFEPVITLTQKDNDTMTQSLGKRSILVSDNRALYIGILGILFGILHDVRSTLGEHTVESPWNIGKLTPQIAFLDSNFATVGQQVIASTKLALCYPLYRHWDLIMAVWDDVRRVLESGKRSVLHYFLYAYRLFATSDQNQVYNGILLHDYCLFLQSSSCRDNVLNSLIVELDKQLATTNAQLGSVYLGDWNLAELNRFEPQDNSNLEINDSDDE